MREMTRFEIKTQAVRTKLVRDPAARPMSRRQRFALPQVQRLPKMRAIKEYGMPVSIFGIIVLLFSGLAASANAANSKASNKPCVAYPDSVAEYEGASLVGCRLISVAPGSILEALGMKRGELISPQKTAANGEGMKLEVFRGEKHTIDENPQEANK